MKANELMIGDWIKPKNVDSCFKVGLIGADSIWTDTDTEWFLDEIEPIPLTAEILKMNGWRQYSPYFSNNNADFEMEQYRDGGFGIRVSADEFGSGLFACIKYVHQLQHTLRLCGIDKEITI